MVKHSIERGLYQNASGTIVEVTGLALNITGNQKQVMAKFQWHQEKRSIELVKEIGEFKSEYTRCD